MRQGVSYVYPWGRCVHKTIAPEPKHSSGYIFIQHHYMLWSLTRRAGLQKPSLKLSEIYICRIVDMTFAEFPFHALQCIEEWEASQEPPAN